MAYARSIHPHMVHGWRDVWNTCVPQVPIAARREIQAASYNLAAQLKEARYFCGWP